MDVKTIGIAGLAGIACVLLVAAASHAGASGLLLFVLAPFPIYAAALAWGTNAAIVASLSAILSAAFALSPQVGVLLGLAISLPASLIGHQANLAQPDEHGKLIWYPLDRLYFNLCLAVTAGLVAMLVYTGYDNAREQMMPFISLMIDDMLKNSPVLADFPVDQIDTLKLRFFEFTPFLISTAWIVVHAFNAHLAGWVCRASGLMPRPVDDIAKTIVLPPVAIAILIGSFILAFIFDGKIGYYTAPVFSVFLTAFSLVGLADLHLRGRNGGGNFMLLVVVYILILMLQFVLYFFAFGGVRRSIAYFRNSRPPAGPTTTNS
ncbi:MAG: hypothetical protein QNJ29_10815 [Rhizobiaceae bacterium]|nr:hypothetical protein [Rhizobiaceae bacterium]